MRSEMDTRHVPVEPKEVAYALNRHDRDRTPTPRPGDQVFYRRHQWDQEPTLATVLDVADLDDREDPNLWHAVRDPHGRGLDDAGVPMLVRAPDPLPWVDLLPHDARDAVEALHSGRTGKVPICPMCGNNHVELRARTWEARVRGMPGWLPLDWRQRPVRLPHEILMRPVLPAIDRWRLENPTGGAPGHRPV